jgi:hypothetical protein
MIALEVFPPKPTLWRVSPSSVDNWSTTLRSWWCGTFAGNVVTVQSRHRPSNPPPTLRHIHRAARRNRVPCERLARTARKRVITDRRPDAAR